MEKGIESNILQVVMLASAIVRRINAKRLDNGSASRLNKQTPEQCAETDAEQA